MSAVVAPNPAPETEPAGRRSAATWIVAAVVVVAVTAFTVMGVMFFQYKTQPRPSFPTMASSPDTSVTGTVAYVADQTGCVRIVAASGVGASKEVLCIPSEDEATMVKLGKTIGPQLVWLSDGRLEVTMFRFDGAPPYRAGWQKVVDVRTGVVTDTPVADVPSTPNMDTHPMVSPSGEKIAFTSDQGKVTITLTGSSGTRTLLDASGPPDGYGLESAFWSPDYSWIAADDGRILVITTGNPSVTRILTDESSSGTSGMFDPGTSRFAVTSQDLMTS